MSGVTLIQRPRTYAAHWVYRFSLFKVVKVEFVGPCIGVTDSNIFGVPGGAAGGGAVLVPTDEFVRYCRWSVKE